MSYFYSKLYFRILSSESSSQVPAASSIEASFLVDQSEIQSSSNLEQNLNEPAR